MGVQLHRSKGSQVIRNFQQPVPVGVLPGQLQCHFSQGSPRIWMRSVRALSATPLSKCDGRFSRIASQRAVCTLPAAAAIAGCDLPSSCLGCLLPLSFCSLAVQGCFSGGMSHHCNVKQINKAIPQPGVFQGT